jgi:hypothetical protein
MPRRSPRAISRSRRQSPRLKGPARDAVPGYQLGAVIGRGGMGEVLAARDERIGREVAIKRLRGAAGGAEAVARFLREAKIQARLEHPAIVPVHDLGRAPDGQPYFAMKRLAGVTLASQLDGASPPPRQRLLRTFADVCSAIEFAHARGVVHRDLKPANIMLGDFGEVYVLDWGLARVLGEHETAIGIDVASLDGMTQAGTVLGTPGYMAPEQVKADVDVTSAVDVYALGSILFEILAGEPLHPRGMAAMATTTTGLDPSPARRRPDRDVPPELDAACASALALDPAQRPTARELAHQIARYLDGDRDVERRRELAMAHLAEARAAMASADPPRRAEGARVAGQALALDPGSREAAELITAYLIEPPRELPAALRQEMIAAEAELQRNHSGTAKLSFLGILACLAIAAWNGVRSPVLFAGIVGLTGLLGVMHGWLSYRTATPRQMLVVAAGNALLVALLSRVFGPLITAPAVCCIMAMSLSSYPQLIERARTVVIPMLVASWLGPVVLEWLGVLAPTWHVGDGEMVSTSHLIEIGGTPTNATLVIVHLTAIIAIGLFANALARSRREAQHQVRTQLWQVRQIVPARA